MKTAMILAAGRGERLRPITEQKPKALCTVHGIPLLAHHITNLVRAGFNKLIINHAYLGGQIRQYVGNGGRWGIEIHYSPEPPGGLETGGGIAQALHLLGTEPFLTVNADIHTDYKFADLSLPEHSLVHLVLVDKPAYSRQGDFGLLGSRLINEDKHYTFTGIACYHPDFFRAAPIGRYSVAPLWREAARKQQATGEVYSGRWFDIGSPERLLAANGLCSKTLLQIS
ncbi:N-acetylmuramate alpha-1-phosphate uridylyltransferase MurU [Legionella septentrionalis]|uniref:N-acetylmuramate alpha-1-phosphate uridylyltransferase MurU n=1 Tax=Legionella septentrionalis TaxID=2498109 RepID=UPI000F8CA24F|nr:nucleotidyltransferase family protein [Legionella septentrionalis]RUR14511.1 nucleotidyltransferase family protein [Legionella septentrionalis]